LAITATRTITLVYSGGVVGTEVISAASNTASPGQIQIFTFTGAGNNTVTVPTGGTTPTAATIVPPAGNTQALILKGVNGDTGVTIHKTDPTTIALDSSVVNFVLNVAGTVTGLQIFWT